MLNAIRVFFTAPVYEGDPEKTLDAKTTHLASMALLVLGILSIPLIAFSEVEQTKTFGLISTTVSTIIWFFAILLVKREKRTAVKIIILSVNTASIYYSIITSGGLGRPTIIVLLFLLAAAHLFFPLRGAIGYGILLLVIASSIYGLQLTGIVLETQAVNTSQTLLLTFIFTVVASAGILAISSVNYQANIKMIQESERELRERNNQLNHLRDSLEQRVTERTVELERANNYNEKRARQFEAVAQVARLTATNEQIEELLPHLASVISGQFGFYHTGIFLLDDSRTNAVLRASNSEGGKRMVQRKHKLQVGQAGIVGFVSATGTPRIALDVGSDAVFFDNPDLPNTRSEMALPLHIADEVIGVLDVQSTEPNAFQQADVEVLSTLANQVSIAIQNAQSFERAQQLLQDAQRVSSIYLQDAWKILESERTLLGYRASGEELQAYTKPLSSVHVIKAIESKQTISEGGKNATLAVPIRLRDEVIGIMDIRTQNEHEWDVDEVDIVEAVAERLSLAIETSLLLKSTQKRAELERITSEISGKLGATSQFDTLLRTAAEELSRVLGGSDVLVQIQPVIDTSTNLES
ncbi:MAG: GAF domain-containing protein [Anaerolineales bacterium]|nr:GAF domain-containing protein [Anaerolineales bacterium]